MKLFRNLFLALFTTIGSIAFVACGNNAVNVSGADYTGLNNAYYVEDSINFDSFVVTVNFSDQTQQSFNLGDYQFDIDPESAQEGTLIVFTDGLYEQVAAGDLQTGTYDIKCFLVGKSTKKEDLLTITIADEQSSLNRLESFKNPELVGLYSDRKIENETLGEDVDKEAYFYSDDVYQVGDDNEFVFKPDYSLVNKTTNESAEDALKTTARVYLGTGTDKVLCETNQYYTYDPATFGFDFTEDAIGKTFTIEVSPKYYTTLANTSQIVPASFVVEVQDGWNVNTALDLGVLNINNLDTDSSKYYSGNTLTEYGRDHYTEYAGNYSRYRNDGNKIFYGIDADQGMTANGYYAKSNNYIWQKFLKTKGYTDDDFAAIGTGINSLFIHGDITVNPEEDLPEDYFIHDYEVTGDTSNAVGSLRDFAMLYQHMVVPTENQEFIFNGNFFTLNFEDIPLVKSKHNVYNDISRLDLFTNSNPAYFAVRATAFLFCGLKNNGSAEEQVTIKNLDTFGNSGGVLSVDYVYDEDKEEWVLPEGEREKLAAAGSLILLKSIEANVTVENNISKDFLISWFSETESTLNLNKVKTYDDFNSGIMAWGNEGRTTEYGTAENFGGTFVNNSEFKRFGGPVALLVSAVTQNKGGDYYSSITFDEDTIFYNPVNGTEAWFALNNARDKATMLIDLDALYKAYGATITNEDGKIELITLSLDQNYIPLDEETAIYYTYTRTTVYDKTNGAIMFKDYGDNSPNLNPQQWGSKTPSSADFVSFLAAYPDNASHMAAAIDTSTNQQTVMASLSGPLCPADPTSYNAIMQQNYSNVQMLPVQYGGNPLTGDYTHINFHMGTTPLGIVLKMSPYTAQPS